MRQLLKIPKGNPCELHICPQRIAPKQQDASFGDVLNLSVRLTQRNRDAIVAYYTLTESGDITIAIPSTLNATTYGIEMTGLYNGHPWRWADHSVIKVTDCNPCSNVTPMETFGEETYYIYDDIFPSFVEDDEQLVLETHGHAWVDGDTLCVMASELTDMEIINNKLIIKQTYGNIENQIDRPSWQCHCR